MARSTSLTQRLIVPISAAAAAGIIAIDANYVQFRADTHEKVPCNNYLRNRILSDSNG